MPRTRSPVPKPPIDRESMTEAASETAPAKINLALHVTGRRADGYHELETLVAFPQIGDELVAEPSRKDRLVLDGPFAEQLRSGETNLVQRAVAAFRERWPEAVGTGLTIRLTKNLPVAAGLGGGSADAAAALRIMEQMSAVPVERKALLNLATTLGADVPMCLVSAPAFASGIGEKLTPLRNFPSMHVVLVNPLKPLATADVFRRLKSRQNEPMPARPDFANHPALLALWLEGTRNDLEPPAIELMPEIGAMIVRLGAAQGCVLARMSGSGATVFGLFGSSAQAHNTAHELRLEWPDYWVAAAGVSAQ